MGDEFSRDVEELDPAAVEPQSIGEIANRGRPARGERVGGGKTRSELRKHGFDLRCASPLKQDFGNERQPGILFETPRIVMEIAAAPS